MDKNSSLSLHSLQCVDEDGNAVEPGTESGELVCATPFPSMPVRFWNDPDGEKYRKAYFAKYPERYAVFNLTTNHGILGVGLSVSKYVFIFGPPQTSL